jgi:hypothetical protein
VNTIISPKESHGYRICRNCMMFRRNHVNDKCLFMPTVFEFIVWPKGTESTGPG